MLNHPAATFLDVAQRPNSKGNSDVTGTAARHVARAMGKVAPRQRAELLAQMIRHAQAAQSVIQCGTVPAGILPEEPSFLAVARDVLGVEAADVRSLSGAA